MTDEEARDQARKNLNPIEDIKGALRFIRDIDPVEEVKEFMETAAEVLDPRQSDVRVVEPEEDTETETADPDSEDRPPRPGEHHPQPEMDRINREYRR